MIQTSLKRVSQRVVQPMLLLALAPLMVGCNKGRFSEVTATVAAEVKASRLVGYVPRTGFVYVAEKGKESYVVRGGSQEGPYDEHVNPVLSRNGEAVAVITGKGSESALLVNGKEVGRGQLWGPVLSNDGAAVAALSGKEAGLLFSPQGGLSSWVATGGAAVLVNGKPLTDKRYDEVSHLMFDAHGHVVYVAKTGNDLGVYRDGVKLSGGYESIERPVDCGDGTVAYLALRGKKRVVAVESRLGGEWNAVLGLACESGVTAYVAKRDDGRLVIVRNGQEEASSEGWDDLTRPALSADGKHWAFVGERPTASCVVVDGIQTCLERGDYIGPWLSAAGESVFTARRVDGKYLVFRNGVQQVDQPIEDLRAVYPTRKSGLVIWKRNEGWLARYGGRTLGPYDDLGDVHENPDGTQVAFAVRYGPQLQQVVVSD